MFDSSEWNVLNQISTQSKSYCEDVKLFGGYDVFYKPTIITNLISLRPHSTLQIKFDFYVFFWLNPSPKVVVYVDGQLLYSLSSINSIRCTKSGWKAYSDTFDQIIRHNFNSALVVIQIYCNWFIYWGIANFRVFIQECPIGCLVCHVTDSTNQCIIWTLSFVSLSEKTLTLFKTEGWQITNNNEGPSICSGIPLLGGYNLCGSQCEIYRQIQLSVHSKVILHFRYFKLDITPRLLNYFKKKNILQNFRTLLFFFQLLDQKPSNRQMIFKQSIFKHHNKNKLTYSRCCFFLTTINDITFQSQLQIQMFNIIYT